MTAKFKTAALAIAATTMAFGVPATAAEVPALAPSPMAVSLFNNAAPVAETETAMQDRRRYRQRDRRQYRDDRRYYSERDDRYERRERRERRTWRGRDGRTYCEKEDGTTGLLIGAVVGGLAGREVARDRTLGAVIGAAVGGLAGREIDRADPACR